MTDAVHAYFGPETVMPMTSVIATIAAMLMMFGKTLWRLSFGWLSRFRTLAGRQEKSAPRPHFSLSARGEETEQPHPVRDSRAAKTPRA